MKVSLITTVKNEEENIEDFLISVINQTKKPAEFIIVDGGSKDNTIKILKNYTKKYKWIKFFVFKNATIGNGRNIAIKKAKNEIIAVTDCGCILHKNWLKNITKPFQNKKVDVVVGIYKPYYINDFEYFQGLIVVPPPRKIFMNPSRMSSKSMAFKKTVWKEVGGYPDLNVGEDTEFNLKLLEKKYIFAFSKNAIVYWKMRKSWKEFFKQFYRYGVGDRKSGNLWKMEKNLMLVMDFWLYIFVTFASLILNTIDSFIIIIALFSLFVLNSLKIAAKSRSLKGFFYGFTFYLIKRVAYILGAGLGK
ncbi:MAG: glycosyltransferase [Candidatus Aenigmatarchaeota archaeon]